MAALDSLGGCQGLLQDLGCRSLSFQSTTSVSESRKTSRKRIESCQGSTIQIRIQAMNQLQDDSWKLEKVEMGLSLLAYEVLSDEEKRRVYDQYGEEGLKGSGHHFHDPFDMFSQ